MKKQKILVSGYFGYETNQLDGQTIKTRNIYQLLDSKKVEHNYELSYFDTQIFQKSKLNVLKMFRSIAKCDKLIYIAAHNNLKYFFPIVYLLSLVFKFEIHYMVVGGWLADFIKNKPVHIKYLRKISGIYPETINLLSRLQDEYNFNNVHQLQNFRIFDENNLNTINRTNENNVKLVFMARVHPMKGIDALFELAEKIENKSLGNVSITIYGPILKEYKEEFISKIGEYNNIEYKGVLQSDDIHSTLCNYDIMLFPTRYYTEGFPGSILDAYISGIPVIATKWQYATEFVEDGVSGIIAEFDNTENFIEHTLKLINNPSLIDSMKSGAREQLSKYSSETAWKILKKNIII